MRFLPFLKMLFSKPYKNKMNSKSTFLWYFLFFMVATLICHWPDCVGFIALYFFCATIFLFIACGNTSKGQSAMLINVQHVITLAISPRLSWWSTLVVPCMYTRELSTQQQCWTEAASVHGTEDYLKPVPAKMPIDNHSKNSSHPSSITYLPLAHHYSSSPHRPPPPKPLPSSSLFTSSPSHLFSDTTCQWDVQCGRMSVWKCVWGPQGIYPSIERSEQVPDAWSS